MLFVKNEQSNMHDNEYKNLMRWRLVGTPGRAMFQKHISALKTKVCMQMPLSLMVKIAAGDGRGITPAIVNSLKQYGANMVTSGNHIFAKREIYSYLSITKIFCVLQIFPHQRLALVLPHLRLLAPRWV